MNEDAEIQAGYTTVKDVRTFYEICGPTDGQDVVLIHTAGADALEWRYVLPALAQEGFHAITLDLPGHGKSLPYPGGPISSIHKFAEFVSSFIEKLNLNEPIVGGCSIGGDIVLDLAAHDREKLNAIISLEAALRTPTFHHLFLSMMETSSGLPGFQRAFYHISRYSHGKNAKPERIKEHAYLHQHAIQEVAHADLTAWNGHDIRDMAGEITCPVLYIVGEDDYFLSDKIISETRESLSDCRFSRMEGIGHYPMLETDEFLDRMLDFLHDVT